MYISEYTHKFHPKYFFDLDWDSTEFIGQSRESDIFITLSLPIQEHNMPLHLFVFHKYFTIALYDVSTNTMYTFY